MEESIFNKAIELNDKLQEAKHRNKHFSSRKFDRNFLGITEKECDLLIEYYTDQIKGIENEIKSL